ncbi:MAG: DUF885 domain-containing protein [Armatimonadetes bacterium]|nr:DUF885 domain-containing protein [Armatimonadota bacterium]
MMEANNRAFRRLVSDYLLERDAFFPSQATFLGLPGHDDKLESLDRDNISQFLSALSKLSLRLDQLNPEELSLLEKMESALFRSEMDSLTRQLTVQGVWKRDSAAYVETALFGCYLLLTRDDRPLEDRLEMAASRLRQIPRLLGEAGRNLSNPPLIFTDLAIEMTSQGIDFLGEFLAPYLDRAGNPLRKAVEKGAEEAIRAFQGYLDYLKTELHPRSTGSVAIGEELFCRILREDHAIEHGCQEIRELGAEFCRESLAALEAAAREIEPGKPWWEVLEKLRSHAPESHQLMDVYRSEIAKARAFVLERDLVGIPVEESLEVVETPRYERAVTPYAAYIPPPPYSRKQLGEFWVTPVSPALDDSARSALLKEHSYFNIPVVALHEAYPGHHLQQIYASILKSDILKRAACTVFVEGWAFYCEELMGQSGFYPDRRYEIFQLKDQYWRAIRVLIDVGLHTGEMTLSEAVELLVGKVYMPRDCAIAEVNRYARDPTQPLSYFIGKKEIHDLRRKYEAKHGKDFSLRRFHQNLLAWGSVPPRYLEMMFSVGDRNSSLEEAASS